MVCSAGWPNNTVQQQRRITKTKGLFEICIGYFAKDSRFKLNFANYLINLQGGTCLVNNAKLAILILGSIIFAYACGQSPSVNTPHNAPVTNAGNTTAPNSAATTDELAAGRGLYKRNCAACHRNDGTGGKITIDGNEINPENLTADKFKNRSDEKLIGYITDGNDEGMPAFKDKLKPDEIKEVVKYIRGELQKK